MKHLTLLPFIGLLTLTGCSAPAIKDADLARISAAEQAKTTESSPQSIIEQAKSNIEDAEEANLAFYSPTYLGEAKKEIAAAEHSLLAGEDPAMAIANALLAQKWIKRGLQNKETVTVKLKPSLDALDVLNEIQAEQFINDDYNEFKSDIKELIILIEQEKDETAVNEQKDLLESFAELETATLEAAYLDPVLVKLEEAKDQDADDFAEFTLANVKQQMVALETYIQTNPRNRKTIAELSHKAIKAAQHAKQVALAVRPLLKLNTEKAEKHILAVEQYLARIGNALNHEDVRHLSLDNQSIVIAQAAETTARRAKAFDRQQGWEKEKQSLIEQVNRLETELSLNKVQLAEARKAVVVSINQQNGSVSPVNATPTKTENKLVPQTAEPTAIGADMPVTSVSDQPEQNKNLEIVSQPEQTQNADHTQQVLKSNESEVTPNQIRTVEPQQSITAKSQVPEADTSIESENMKATIQQNDLPPTKTEPKRTPELENQAELSNQLTLE